MGGEQLESNKPGNFNRLVVSLHLQQGETRRSNSKQGATSSWKVAVIVVVSVQQWYTAQRTTQGQGLCRNDIKNGFNDARIEADKSNRTERYVFNSNPFPIYLWARTPPQNRCVPEKTKVILLLGPSNENSNTLQSTSCVNGVITQLLSSEVQLPGGSTQT